MGLKAILYPSVRNTLKPMGIFWIVMQRQELGFTIGMSESRRTIDQVSKSDLMNHFRTETIVLYFIYYFFCKA